MTHVYREWMTFQIHDMHAYIYIYINREFDFRYIYNYRQFDRHLPSVDDQVFT